MTADHHIVKQCKTCPWRVDCDPERDIPNGYSVELHESLRGTIKSGLESLPTACAPMRTMACHYSKPGQEIPCAGWLHNQLGPGNNFGVRLAVMGGHLPVPEVDGEQHETFDDTLPKSARRASDPRSSARLSDQRRPGVSRARKEESMQRGRTKRRFVVRYSWDGDSLDDDRDHTWDVIDRETGKSVRNTDTRAQARAAAAELEAEHAR